MVMAREGKSDRPRSMISPEMITREYQRRAMQEYGLDELRYQEEATQFGQELYDRIWNDPEKRRDLFQPLDHFSQGYIVPLIEKNRAIDPTWRCRYYVVYAHDSDDLSRMVHERMSKGWSLVGTMAVVVIRTTVIPEQHGGGSYCDVKFFQAMARD